MSRDSQITVRGLITGKEYPARANRLGEAIGWIDLTRTCRNGHTETLTVDERHQAIPPHGYCITCWPINSGRSPTPKWIMRRNAETHG